MGSTEKLTQEQKGAVVDNDTCASSLSANTISVSVNVCAMK